MRRVCVYSGSKTRAQTREAEHQNKTRMVLRLARECLQMMSEQGLKWMARVKVRTAMAQGARMRAEPGSVCPGLVAVCPGEEEEKQCKKERKR